MSCGIPDFRSKVSRFSFAISFSVFILSTGWVIFYTIPMDLYFVLLFSLLIPFVENSISKDKIMFFLSFLGITLYASIPYNLDFSGNHFHVIIIYLLLPFLFLLSDKSICIIYKYLEKILLFILIPGIVFHILSLFNIL